jgi:hypothetical protein
MPELQTATYMHELTPLRKKRGRFTPTKRGRCPSRLGHTAELSSDYALKRKLLWPMGALSLNSRAVLRWDPVLIFVEGCQPARVELIRLPLTSVILQDRLTDRGVGWCSLHLSTNPREHHYSGFSFLRLRTGFPMRAWSSASPNSTGRAFRTCYDQAIQYGISLWEMREMRGE